MGKQLSAREASDEIQRIIDADPSKKPSDVIRDRPELAVGIDHHIARRPPRGSGAPPLSLRRDSLP